MRNNRDVQKIGEDVAAALLEKEGWTVLHRNWSLRLGELDLVARRGDCLAFVDPALGVDWRKQRRLRRVAEAYLAFEKPVFRDCRFDVISVVVGESGVEVVHHVNAF